MADTSLRHLTMLARIPAFPRKVTVRQLHEHLSANEQDIDVRSVERDLHKLSTIYPLIKDDERPAGWSWSEGVPALSMPPISPESALTYELLSRYVAPLMPRVMKKQLQAQFDRARQELDRYQDTGHAKWARRIAAVPQMHSLLPPEIEAGVVDVAYDALLRSRRFRVKYRAIQSARASEYVVNPLGLVQAGSVFYLVSTLFDYDDVKHLALHRMSDPQALDEPARVPKGFSLDRHVRSDRQFEYPNGGMIRLQLIVEPWLARHLEECRLSRDQVIKPIRDRDELRATATVADTELLFRWLRSLGPNVEVIKPTALRRQMREEIEALGDRYRRAP